MSLNFSLSLRVCARETVSRSFAEDGVRWRDLGSLLLLTFWFKHFFCLGLLGSWGYRWHHIARLIFCVLVESGFHHVVQAGLKLLTSGDPLVSAPQSAGITGVSHLTQPSLSFYMVLHSLVQVVLKGCLVSHWSANHLHKICRQVQYFL